MPVPVTQKKFAAAKAEASRIANSKVTVGPSKEELEKKYGKFNKPVTIKKEDKPKKDEIVDEEDTSEENVTNENEDIDEEDEVATTDEDNENEEETKEEDSEEEEDKLVPVDEEETIEEETEDKEAEKEHPFEDEAIDRVEKRGKVHDSDLKIATIPDNSVKVTPKKESEPFKFDEKFIQIKKNPFQEIKDTLNFDLDKIEIEKSDNDLILATMENYAFSEDSIFQVVLLKSGYVAHMSAMTFKDRDAIRGSLGGRSSNKDTVNIRRKIYKIIYNKIKWTSIGKISFDDFLNITAYDDLDTLFYGIFCKTNPKNSNFTIRCPYCNFPNKREVSPASLINVANKDLFMIKEILDTPNLTPSELVKKSFVSKTQRILLPNSKIIAEVKVPCLNDYLRFSLDYANFSDAGILDKDLSETIGFLIFLKRFLIPNFERIKATGRPVFNEVKDFNGLVDIVTNLGLADGETLVDAINEREAKYKVGYSIKSTPCSKCGKELGNSSVSMEDFLL